MSAYLSARESERQAAKARSSCLYSIHDEDCPVLQLQFLTAVGLPRQQRLLPYHKPVRPANGFQGVFLRRQAQSTRIGDTAIWRDYGFSPLYPSSHQLNEWVLFESPSSLVMLLLRRFPDGVRCLAHCGHAGRVRQRGNQLPHLVYTQRCMYVRAHVCVYVCTRATKFVVFSMPRCVCVCVCV